MDQWGEISKRFDEWSSPLRPCLEDVELFKNHIKPSDKILLLGVTKELLPFATVTVDNNPTVIENTKANAILADWKDLPFENAFDTIIGDGCLTVFEGEIDHFFKQIQKALKPNGKLILRVFISPDEKEELEEIISNAEKKNFHAFKWRVAHSLASPYVPVKKIYETLSKIWNHPTLEVYKSSNHIYYFPKLMDLPKYTSVEFPKNYELAERCPVVCWQF